MPEFVSPVMPENLPLLFKGGTTLPAMIINPASWSTNVGGGGAVTPSGNSINCNTNTTANSWGLAFTPLYGTILNNPISWADHDKQWYIQMSIMRTSSDAEVTGVVRLFNQSPTTRGIINGKGWGILINNLTVNSESYGTARGSNTLGVTLTTAKAQDVLIVHYPAVKTEWWVDSGSGWSLKYTETNTSRIPSGNSGGGVSAVVYLQNGATGNTNPSMVLSGLRIWQGR